MLNLKKLSVTGMPGAGKSTVCLIFKELGAWIVSADEIVHMLLIPDSEVGRRVIQLLGTDIVKANTLDRKIIAEKVFSNILLLKKLEEIIHPEVHRIIRMNYKDVCDDGTHSLFVSEVPLLYESQTESFYDIVILVTAEQQTCLSRFIEKRGGSESDFYKRCQRFLSVDECKVRSDFVIENEGTVQQLREKVTKINTLIL